MTKPSVHTIHIDGLILKDTPASEATPAPAVGRVDEAETVRPVTHSVSLVLTSDELLKNKSVADVLQYIVRWNTPNGRARAGHARD